MYLITHPVWIGRSRKGEGDFFEWWTRKAVEVVLIGNSFLPRLAIGMEILANDSVLFLDEVTLNLL
jgi:hypothetical protein